MNLKTKQLEKTSYLNTIWGTTMGIQTTRKPKNGFWVCKEIGSFPIPSIECIGILYWSYKTAKTKFANKTMIKTVMLMRKFRAGIVGMMTFFLRKLFL